jgi:hypothetical protein
VLRRLRARAGTAARNVLRALRVPLPDDLGSELRGLAHRGVALEFIFSRSDPGGVMLFEEGGTLVSRLIDAGKLFTQTIDGADHTFTARWTHERLLTAIGTALARR